MDFLTWVKDNQVKNFKSIRQFSSKAGLTPSHVSEIFNGKLEVGLTFCKGVARALSLSPLEVVLRADLIPIDDQTKECLLTFFSLPKEIQSEICRYVKYRSIEKQ